jgi:hypothetical protein
MFTRQQPSGNRAVQAHNALSFARRRYGYNHQRFQLHDTLLESSIRAQQRYARKCTVCATVRTSAVSRVRASLESCSSTVFLVLLSLESCSCRFYSSERCLITPIRIQNTAAPPAASEVAASVLVTLQAAAPLRQDACSVLRFLRLAPGYAVYIMLIIA